MPEVQKPVLEHATPETRKEEITRGGDVVNLVTSVTEIRKMDSPRMEVSYTMETYWSAGTAKLISMTEPVYKFIE